MNRSYDPLIYDQLNLLRTSSFISTHYSGKVPVSRIWSNVRRRPYLFTAAMAALYPPPYAGDASWAIWCIKNSPSLFSTVDLPPFLDADQGEYDDDEEEEDEAVKVVDGMLNTSDSSHRRAST